MMSCAHITIANRAKTEGVKRLYHEGYSDFQISNIIGIKRDAVGYWREINHLPSNGLGKGRKVESACPPNCKYAGTASGAPCCDYIFIEGHSRGCKGGKDCLKYEKCEEKQNRYTKFLISNTSWQTFAKTLYDNGESDTAIAKKTGIPKAVIVRWIDQEGLEHHVTEQELAYEAESKRRQEVLNDFLNRNNITCYRLARILGVNEQTIRNYKHGCNRVSDRVLEFIDNYKGGESK